MAVQFLKVLVEDFFWVAVPTVTWLFLHFGPGKLRDILMQAFRTSTGLAETVLESVRFSERLRVQSKDLEARLTGGRDSFLRESFQLVRDRSLSTEELRGVLKARVCAQFDSEQMVWKQVEAQVRNPVVVSVLVALGTLAFCFQTGESVPWNRVCTLGFWGVFMSQFGLQGIVDRLQFQAAESRRRNTVIAVACRSVSERVNPYLMTEELNSFLPHPERVDWHQVAKSLQELPGSKTSVTPSLLQFEGEGRSSLPQGF